MAITFGHHLLNEAIPAGYRPEGVYTKKKLQTAMTRLAKEHPDKYPQVITEVKALGDMFATLDGVSVGLDDVAPLYKERNAIMHPAIQDFKKAKTRDERIAVVAKTQDKLIEHAAAHPGTMGMMARSGSRGNQLQLMRAVAGPAAAADEHDHIQPWLTTNSYSEGLKPSEWWATAREARMAEVKTRVEVTEPGDLSKTLSNNTSDQVVTIGDCNTHNGLHFATSDAAILDRYLAKPTGGFPYNTLITPRVVSQLVKQNVTHVIARSPMTCEAREGLCQHCVGINVQGRHSPIGENIGIRAAHAMGEPLTQLALNAKHGVRVSGENPLDIKGLEGFKMLIESPESFKNKATLAPKDGHVHAVTAAPQGGHYITVGTNKLYAAHGLQPLVKPGDKVFAGDALSAGVPKPDEVVRLKGLGAGRDYLVNQLGKIYKSSGVDVDRRHYEVLAKATLNHLNIDEVSDADSAEHGLIRGDRINYNQFVNVIADKAKQRTVDTALGHHLGEGVLHHLAGTKITEPMVDEFKRAGVTHVKTTMNAPLVSPLTAPATRNPLYNPDFLARLGHRYLKQTLLEGAHEGHKSNIHGTHPVPGLVFSTEFGEGISGRY